MNVPGSLSFWVIFGVVLAAGLFVVLRHERSRHRQPTQRRGVQPHQQARLIVVDLGAEGYENNVSQAYHMTTDPEAYARAFVPSDHKE